MNTKAWADTVVRLHLLKSSLTCIICDANDAEKKLKEVASQNNIFLLGNIAVNVRFGDVAFDKIFLFHSIRLLFVKMLVNFYLSHLVTLN